MDGPMYELLEEKLQKMLQIQLKSNSLKRKLPYHGDIYKLELERSVLGNNYPNLQSS
jgi:hypothetical protein